MAAGLSGMMKHYLQKKQEYDGCILFYRLGDFYEMFYEDAELVSKELGLTLTSKSCGLAEKAPMCGIPYRSAENYIVELLNRNYKVAVCDQLTEAGDQKGLVERDVTQIVTPGTILENGLLFETKNNFLASIFAKNIHEGAIAYADISTGEFFACKYNNNLVSNLNAILSQIMPREIMGNNEALKLNKQILTIAQEYLPKIEDGKFFDIETSEAKKIITQKVVDFNENDECIIKACCNLICYAAYAQKQIPLQINKIKIISTDNSVGLDLIARKNLDLVTNSHDGKRAHSLLSVLSYTKTSMGGRKLTQIVSEPICNIREIELRQNVVDEFYNNRKILTDLQEMLCGMTDLQRLSSKLASINFNPKDALSLSKGLQVLPKIKNIIANFRSEKVKKCLSEIEDFTDVVSLIDNAIDVECSTTFKVMGNIKPSFNSELEELVRISKNSNHELLRIENMEKEKTGIKNLKVSYTSVFGFYIEVTNSQKDLVPFRYVRKQTTTNAERYITEELKVLEEKILGAEEKIFRLENRIFSQIKDILKQKIEQFQIAANAVSEIDYLASFAYAAIKNNYVRPKVDNSDLLKIVDGRHPIVEDSLPSFVPNNTNLDSKENKIMLVTGPNMSGKSTYMRQVALIALMAQMGSFVPAKEAQIGIIDRVFTRIGASDDIAFGQSTFMVEMVEVANILKNSTNRSLIILDEVGRGTSTLDGMAIAQAILEYLSKNIDAKVLFSTHYHELIVLEERFNNIKNYCVSVKEIGKSIHFLHKILRGGANRSYGIEVAELAGIPEEVTLNAKDILSKAEVINNNKEIAVVRSVSTNEKQIISVLSETNLNELSPLASLELLQRLQDGLKG